MEWLYEEFRYRLDSHLVDECVVVNLCKPYEFVKHKVLINNGHGRRYSNLSDGALNGHLFDSRDPDDVNCREAPWFPRRPSDQSAEGPDYVVIRLRDQCDCNENIEGVAVQCTGPVAIRVEIHRSTDWSRLLGHCDDDKQSTNTGGWGGVVGVIRP